MLRPIDAFTIYHPSFEVLVVRIEHTFGALATVGNKTEKAGAFGEPVNQSRILFNLFSELAPFICDESNTSMSKGELIDHLLDQVDVIRPNKNIDHDE
jgi:hypothetical protein